MILLDTNVIVDALDKSQANHQWAKKQIEDGRRGRRGDQRGNAGRALRRRA